jgi:hypothetical protein
MLKALREFLASLLERTARAIRPAGGGGPGEPRK